MIKISVTGPESTGKSQLSRQLAEYYQAAWVPEYARNYLETLSKSYTYDDILAIAKGQFYAEKKASVRAKILFCDTDFLVAQIWCRVKYGKVHAWINRMVSCHKYDLYLLCDVDLPWQYDPLREHPEMRSELFEMYRSELEKMKVNFRIVSGIGDNRLKSAVKYVDETILRKRNNKF